MLHFIATTEKIIVEELVRLFRDNVQKLHGLLESVILDRGPQFIAELMKELNEILGIEMKLFTAFHLQTGEQIERTNQELEQYLRMYINHRQNNWSEQLATAEFTFNNKIHTVTKSLLFKVNYRQELRIGFKIRKKEKHVKAEEFVKEMKEIDEEAKKALRKSQEEIKKYVDRNKKKVVEYKVGDRMLLSTKDLIQQMRNRKTKKLMEKFVELYKIKKVISENIVELELLVLMKIHLGVNVSWIVLYQEQVEEQKKIPPPLVKIDGEKEYEVEKILNR